MAQYLEITLSLEDSKALLNRIGQQELPYQLVETTADIFDVWIDGAETVHQLHLRPDGTWYMSTSVEV